jgi:hypothetical protein
VRSRSQSILAVAAAAAAGLALLAYLSSFAGMTMENIFPLFGILLVWLLVNSALLFSMKAKRGKLGFGWNWWKSLTWPRWAKWLNVALFLLWVAHWLADLWVAQGGMAEIRGGAYILNARGHITEISQSGYLRVKGFELRLIAWWFVLAFITIAMDWWFSREQRNSND